MFGGADVADGAAGFVALVADDAEPPDATEAAGFAGAIVLPAAKPMALLVAVPVAPLTSKPGAVLGVLPVAALATFVAVPAEAVVAFIWSTVLEAGCCTPRPRELSRVP